MSVTRKISEMTRVGLELLVFTKGGTQMGIQLPKIKLLVIGEEGGGLVKNPFEIIRK